MKTKLIYPVLSAVMRNKKITLYDIARELNVTYMTVYNKMTGVTDWTLKEAVKIKGILNYKESIDTLFFTEF